MMAPWSAILTLLDTHPVATVVTVIGVAGSAPREVGARLVVAPDKSFYGTIGGGTLEFEAIDAAVHFMSERAGEVFSHRRWALGPTLGQCCGGQVHLAMETFSRARIDEIRALRDQVEKGSFTTEMFVGPTGNVTTRTIRAHDHTDGNEHGCSVTLDGGVLRERFHDSRTPLLLFGAGHVGKAVVLALATLPFRVGWIDARAHIFPARRPANVTAPNTHDPVAAISTADTGTEVLIMTHDHALDLAIADRALAADTIDGIGMIGSATKAARMRSRLLAAGHSQDALARFRCPIGIAGITAKDPSAIAASIAAELLIRREARTAFHSKGHQALAGAVGGV